MTDREAPHVEDLSAWLPDGWDDDLDWGDYPADRAAQPAGPPWYRSPRLLLALIGMAAVTLVVAAALLVTGDGSGELPTRPRLGTPTPSAAPPSPSRAAPSPGSPVSSSPSAATALPSAPQDAPDPVEPAAPPAAPAPPVDLGPDDSDGPRINVTRSPMSFTPGSSAER